MAISEEHMVRIILCTVGIELTYLKGINSKNDELYAEVNELCLSYLEDTHAD